MAELLGEDPAFAAPLVPSDFEAWEQEHAQGVQQRAEAIAAFWDAHRSGNSERLAASRQTLAALGGTTIESIMYARDIQATKIRL